MKINKKSWHYKYYKNFHNCFDEDVSKNLCGYFWGIIGAILGTLLLTAIMLLLIYILTLPIIAPIYKYLLNNPKTDLTGPYMIGGLEILLVLIGTICYLKHNNSFIGLIFEYLSAKKKKICPLIEFED